MPVGRICPEHGWYDDSGSTLGACCPEPVHTYPTPVHSRAPFKCPCCDGMGKRSRPPWAAGDLDGWVASNTALYECVACHGTGLVWEPRP